MIDLGVEILFGLKALNRRTQPCSEEKANEHLSNILRCLGKQRLQSGDRCWPLAARTQLPRATSSIFCERRYDDVEQQILLKSARNVTTTKWDACVNSSQLVAACRLDMCAFDLREKPLLRGDATMAHVYQARFEHPQLEEKLAMDISALLANFGGIIGTM